MKNIDYVGTKINDIEIVGYHTTTGGHRRCYFDCKCHCGKNFTSRAESIKNGYTKSCGCKTAELMAIGHIKEGNIALINILFARYSKTASRKNKEFSLSLDQFKSFIFSNCTYCGTQPRLSKFSGRGKDKFLAYNGIDRVDNSIGYVFDNCVACCSICNGAKSDMSLEEFKSWITQIVKFTNEGNNGSQT